MANSVDTKKSDWCSDSQYEEVALAEVRRESNGYSLKRADGWSLFISDPGFEPRPGQLARFYGRGIGSPVRGVVIDGSVCYYRTLDEDDQHQKDLLYPRTAAEALAKWDRGESLFTVEMGGIGPGYEQCIQVLALEIIRAALATGVVLEEASFRKLSDDTIARVDKYLGLSGAQAGAAKWLAFRALRDGWQHVILAHPNERLIQVSNRWPHVPRTDEAQATTNHS